MIETIITAIETILNAKSALDLVSSVSRYVKRKSQSVDPREAQGSLSKAEKQRALEATLDEWGHIASVVEPSIKEEINRCHGTSLGERAEFLAKLAKQYAAVRGGSSLPNWDHLSLKHTAVAVTPEGKLRLLLGQSEQTKYLRGEVIDIAGRGAAATPHHEIVTGEPSGGKMKLPVFKVTMLGESGVGKTVFMSSMYTGLREAPHGIAIRATDHDVDLELDQNMRSLYVHKKWPPGTEANERKYEFELLLRNKPIALIDWVDYRGGALGEPATQEGGATLIKRLQESHSVIWMIDMSLISGCHINSTQARLMTGVGRMAHFCRQAARGRSAPQSILFVRTKSDEVVDGKGLPDLGKACEQLIEHLGPNNFSDIACSAAIPVSSVGRVSGDKKPVGDNPLNVEWPLILSLAYLLRAELDKLDEHEDSARQEVLRARPGRLVELIKEALVLPPGPKELEALQNWEALLQQVAGMREVIEELQKHCPRSIRQF